MGSSDPPCYDNCHHYMVRRMTIVRQFAVAVISLTCLFGCSLEPEGLRPIRAHTFDYQGIAHAYPPSFAPRYCQKCHGERLQGGQAGEPSCFRCHGQRWSDIDGSLSRAPEDHTLLHDRFLHRAGYEDPETNCSTCHGDVLQGSMIDGTPSCFLCHDSLWESL